VKEGRASVTAQRVAMCRAAHQLLDHPRVFDDPLAVTIVGTATAESLSGSKGAGVYLRAFVAARGRFAEDELERAVERGVRQYVVLGAGLDTFAYRNRYPNLQVFEVDHPATQTWKHQRLRSTGISVPPSVTFVPVDFESQSFVECLAFAGYHAQSPGFFSWLGVTPYLNRNTVFATLERIRTMSNENGVVFDYAVPRSSLGTLGKIVFDGLAGRVAAAGEPFQSFFAPDELVRHLGTMGFRHIEDLDGEQINARYFANRTDRLRVADGLGRLLCARG
jgi:methyltransferase (TIGR00027 family)